MGAMGTAAALAAGFFGQWAGCDEARQPVRLAVATAAMADAVARVELASDGELRRFVLRELNGVLMLVAGTAGLGPLGETYVGVERGRETLRFVRLGAAPSEDAVAVEAQEIRLERGEGDGLALTLVAGERICWFGGDEPPMKCGAPAVRRVELRRGSREGCRAG